MSSPSFPTARSGPGPHYHDPFAGAGPWTFGPVRWTGAQAPVSVLGTWAVAVESPGTLQNISHRPVALAIQPAPSVAGTTPAQIQVTLAPGQTYTVSQASRSAPVLLIVMTSARAEHVALALAGGVLAGGALAVYGAVQAGRQLWRWAERRRGAR